MQMLRCSPCTEHPLLEEIDNILRKGVCAIANLALTDVQWLQASLPVKEGGLGVRRVTSLAPSAFLASATGTETLQQQLLLRSTQAGSMTQLLPPSGMYGRRSTTPQVHRVLPRANSRHGIRWWWLQSARHWLTA